MSEHQKPKRRWFRFSLRTMFVLMTVAGASFGWLSVKVRAKQREREAVTVIKRLGGSIHYDYELGDDRIPIDPAVPSGPVWLQKILGQDFCASVVGVSLEKVDRTEADEWHLRAFPTLKHLYLNGRQTTDATLAHLEGMKQLRGIDLCNATITDAGLGHLRGLTQLEGLILAWTPVTDAGLVHLQGMNQLKQLSLSGTGVTDVGLTHLRGLTQLKGLNVNAPVTDAGIERLQKALPNLIIHR